MMVYEYYSFVDVRCKGKVAGFYLAPLRAASFSCLDFGGHGDAKTGAAWGFAGCRQRSAMRVNDGAADAESHAGAVRFGGKKCIEDLVRLARGQPYARIADGQENFLVFSSLRLDDEFPSSIHILHRIDAVHDA